MSDSEIWVPTGIAYMVVGDEYARRMAVNVQLGRSYALEQIITNILEEKLICKSESYTFDNSYTFDDESWPDPDYFDLTKHPDAVLRASGNGILPRDFWIFQDFAEEHWVSGDLYGDYRKALGVSFAIEGLPCAETVRAYLAIEAAKLPIQPPRGGRPPASWWPDFAEELAVYIHANGLPEEPGGVDRVIQAIQARMAKAGKVECTRTQVQGVISAVLARLRAGEADD